MYKDKEIAEYAFAQVGGIVDYLALPKTRQEMKKLLAAADKAKLAVHVLGQLSNMLISDQGVAGLVIITSEMKTIHIDQNKIVADAGIDMISVSEFAYEHGLSGLEWAAGLPGSVGGAVYMNAGAYGGNTADCLKSVIALDHQGKSVILTKEKLGFSYRNSGIQRNDYYIVQAVFELEKDDPAVIRHWMDEFNLRRISKQPLNLPSNGSVFKRPTGYYAGKLVSEAGLQGIQIGGAQLSTKHANFIVNVDHATTADYLDLINLVKHTIRLKDHIDMELEIKMIGKGFTEN
ncbi:UDP-N-acetylmuramate dehydrogenase [Oenococcus sicerae]|uniref:UDP-N-acetylenolpyruvoylglucosamine reductase n=1 Tax=Oenococcus sicerae TaxID=2203724 RepID=A0AAJ1R9Z4_9LACO|nr:UDP-N-acetylmuramate dehydrogenase [Oenococcus sicerae]QAS69497.1 UDP-N-acetylmuramate dehydrogenase [Oenococcus sicerae]